METRPDLDRTVLRSERRSRPVLRIITIIIALRSTTATSNAGPCVNRVITVIRTWWPGSAPLVNLVSKRPRVVSRRKAALLRFLRAPMSALCRVRHALERAGRVSSLVLFTSRVSADSCVSFLSQEEREREKECICARVVVRSKLTIRYVSGICNKIECCARLTFRTSPLSATLHLRQSRRARGGCVN